MATNGNSHRPAWTGVALSVVFKESEDIIGTICDFLRSEKIGLLVVGQPTGRGLAARLSPGIVNLILERMSGFDILVVEISHS